MATQSATKLDVFVWQGTDRKGNNTRGEISGSNQAAVKAQLRKQGIAVKTVKRKPKDLFAPRKKPISPADIAIFARQLATMMKAGVPLVQSFEIVADGLENPSMRELVMNIRTDVSAGGTLADALRKHPRQFDDLFCNLVESGEQSGALETMLDRVATYKEKTEALKAKIKKAMKYPITVVAVAIVVTAILLIKVVPQFAETFSSFGAGLPAFTQFVLDISEFVQAWWWIILIGLIVFGLIFREAKMRFKSFRDFLDRISLKLPIFGKIIKEAAVARFSRTLATTFAAGVPLVDALDSVAGAAGNDVYYRAVMDIKNDVTTGIPLNMAIRSTDVFPNMLIQMTAIGEESGALDEMLDKVATYYEEAVDNSVDGLTSMMEPLIMSVLGVLVGGLMVAMYLPIFMLGSVM